MKGKQRLQIEAWEKWFQKKIDSGWMVYLVTLQLKRLDVSMYEAKEIFKRDATTLYKRLLTRVCRRAREAKTGELPIFIGCPDFPVPKLKEKQWQPQMPLNGIHYGGLIAIPPNSRLKDQSDPGIRKLIFNLFNKVEVSCSLGLDHVPVNDRGVVGYTLKQVLRGTVPDEEVLHLPLSKSELASEKQVPVAIKGKLLPFEMMQALRNILEKSKPRLLTNHQIRVVVKADKKTTVLKLVPRLQTNGTTSRDVFNRADVRLSVQLTVGHLPSYTSITGNYDDVQHDLEAAFSERMIGTREFRDSRQFMKLCTLLRPLHERLCVRLMKRL